MTDSRRKGERKPRWWFNTYFWFAFILFVLGILGFLHGPQYIMDPGQPFTARLPWVYLFAAVLFLINGYVSHLATVNDFRRSHSEDPDA